ARASRAERGERCVHSWGEPPSCYGFRSTRCYEISSATESVAQGAPMPKPGSPVRGSRSGRPIMVLLDELGRRWSLRVLWALREGPLTFRSLRVECDDVSPSVLAQRLAELRELELIEIEGEGYALSTHGRALGEMLVPLDAWAKRWAASLPRGRKRS